MISDPLFTPNHCLLPIESQNCRYVLRFGFNSNNDNNKKEKLFTIKLNSVISLRSELQTNYLKYKYNSI